MGEMLVKEACKVMQANCGIDEGDKVELVRLPFRYDYPLGRRADVIKYLRNYMGNIFTARHTIGRENFSIGLAYNVPFYCLELVEKADPPIKVGSYEVEFYDNGIKVCGIKIPTETIRKILDRLEN